MDCKNCASLNQNRQFSSSGEVSRFLRRLRSLVEDGRIVEFPSFTDLEDVEDDASWPDVIECQFGCPDCGREFAFKANSHSKKAPEWTQKRATHRRR
jgi:hypothetical protein